MHTINPSLVAIMNPSPLQKAVLQAHPEWANSRVGEDRVGAATDPDCENGLEGIE